MNDENNVIAGAKILGKGVKLIHRDIVKPGVKSSVNLGKRLLNRKKKKQIEEVDF